MSDHCRERSKQFGVMYAKGEGRCPGLCTRAAKRKHFFVEHNRSQVIVEAINARRKMTASRSDA
jgi:hypothetical protein